jgi:outer membrane protein assembly factor BamB
VIGGRVYTLGATGLLNCLDGASGKAIWSVDILKDNDAGNISHGVCSSPLLVDEKVLVCPTGKNGPTLAAYHRDTGQRLWQGGTKQAGYGSPLLAELDGVRQVLLTDSTGVAGYDPDTGTALWEFAWSNTDKTNCSQPWPNAGGPGQVFVSTGYGKGCALVRVERGTSGVWSATPRWQSRAMKTKFTSAVEHRGHIYGLDDGILECLDLKKGKIVWKDGRYGHGQILLAGDLLIVQAEDGEVVLVDPSPEGLRELGRLPALAGKTWNHPAVAGRYLLVRNDQEAACYELELDEN